MTEKVSIILFFSSISHFSQLNGLFVTLSLDAWTTPSATSTLGFCLDGELLSIEGVCESHTAQYMAEVVFP